MKENEKMTEEFKCPLCKSILSESRYYEIVGVWEAKKKFEEQTKKELAEAKLVKEKLIKQTREIREKSAKKNEEMKKRYESQFEKQKLILIKKTQEDIKRIAKKDIDRANKEKLELERKLKKDIRTAQKEFLEKGKEHEKKRTERLSESLKLKTEDWKRAMDQIKELKEQLKKGTTPQIEGLNLEEALVKELKEKFPGDIVERHGHMGDIMHYVVHKDKKIGLILYECKKTQKFQKNYVNQIKEDVAKRNASYGVLVTVASEKNKVGFWVDKDILIVHPYGTIYIAEVLRKWLISICSMKLNKEELSDCARRLLDYIKSDKFKNSVKDTIHRARELNDLLKKEMTTHKNIWEKRLEHYNHIAEHSSDIEKESEEILSEEKTKELEPIQIQKRKKKEEK